MFPEAENAVEIFSEKMQKVKIIRKSLNSLIALLTPLRQRAAR
jgi:hypothetical protein